MGRNVVNPTSAMLASAPAPFAAAMGRRLQRANEIIGSAARRSCAMKRIEDKQNTAAAVTPPSGPSDRPASVKAIKSDATATVNKAAPSMSMERRSCFECSFRKQLKPSAAMMPMGTLIQKIHGQDQSRMISPPVMGPSTAEIAHTLAR
jgi:hypothetical protein